MKIINILAVFLFLGLCIESSLAQTNIYVKSNSGVQTAIPLEQLETLTFSNGNLKLLKVDGESETDILSTIQYISFREYKTTVVTDVTKSTFTEEFVLFPNPVQGVFFISANNLTNIEIINALGEVVLQTTYVGESGINVNSLTQGMYICCIKQGNTQSFKRFIKE